MLNYTTKVVSIYGSAFFLTLSSCAMQSEQHVNMGSEYRLHEAVKAENVRRVRELLEDESIDVDAKDADGATPLFHAVISRPWHEEIILDLLRAGASKDIACDFLHVVEPVYKKQYNNTTPQDIADRKSEIAGIFALADTREFKSRRRFTEEYNKAFKKAEEMRSGKLPKRHRFTSLAKFLTVVSVIGISYMIFKKWHAKVPRSNVK